MTSAQVTGDALQRELISVVIPCYNQARFLDDAIRSVLAQTYAHVEIVVVDDGSPDNTVEVAGRYPQVTCVRQRNQGLSAARNTGTAHARGDYLLYLDADDRLLPDALETSYAFVQAHPECAMIAGHYSYIEADGRLGGTPTPHGIDRDHYLELLRRNYIGMHGAVLYRRAAIEAVGGFDVLQRACEDYDVYLRIAKSSPILCHTHVVAEYRRHGEGLSSKSALMLASALRALGRQEAHVRAADDARLLAAYRQGEHSWRNLYGRELALSVIRDLKRFRIRPMLRDLSSLLPLLPGRAAWLIRRRMSAMFGGAGHRG